MNVLVEEQCLKNIAESIRRKSGKTTTYKPREMAVAIDNLQTGGSGCLVKIEQSANQKIMATYKGKTYTDGDFFVLLGESFQTSITADKYYTAGTLNYKGTPLKGDITVKATRATEARKYRVTIVQSANQTITATYDGKNYTSTFYAYEGSRITFAVKSDINYDAGTLNYTEISSLNSKVTVRATAATLATPKVNYIGKTFYISDGNASIKYCKFREIDETFRINIGSSGLTISGNEKFQQFLENSRSVYFDYWGVKIATFNNSSKAQRYDYNMLRNFASGTEMTVTK